jgi:hypothetical protein
MHDIAGNQRGVVYPPPYSTLNTIIKHYHASDEAKVMSLSISFSKFVLFVVLQAAAAAREDDEAIKSIEYEVLGASEDFVSNDSSADSVCLLFSGRLLVKFTRLQVAAGKPGDEDVTMEAPTAGSEASPVSPSKKALAKLGRIPKGPKVSLFSISSSS